MGYYSEQFDQVSHSINRYHIPGTSGGKISHELLRGLMRYPQLVGDLLVDFRSSWDSGPLFCWLPSVAVSQSR